MPEGKLAYKQEISQSRIFPKTRLRVGTFKLGENEGEGDMGMVTIWVLGVFPGLLV